MKRKSSLLILFLAVLVVHVCGQQRGSDGWQKSKNLMLPFLDSLKVKMDQVPDGVLYLESVFPASGLPADFHNFHFEGEMVPFNPVNDKQNGMVTEPLKLFNDARLSFVYSITLEDVRYYMDLPFRFTSRLIRGKNGKEMIRQELQIDLQDSRMNMLEMRFLMLSIEGWPLEKVDENTNRDFMLFRHLFYSNDGKDVKVHYMQRDVDGVYKLVDFTDGCDWSYAEFKGGRFASQQFVKEHIQHPREVLDRKLTGAAVVQVLVSETGEVIEAEVIASDQKVFNEEALRLAYLSSGQWEPATHNGKPIRDVGTMAIRFEEQTQPIKKEDYFGESPEEESIWETISVLKALFVLLFLIMGIVLYFKYRASMAVHTKPSGNAAGSRGNSDFIRPVDDGLPNDKMVVIAGMNMDKIRSHMDYLRKIDEAQSTIDAMIIHPVSEYTSIITFSTNIPLYMFYSVISSFNPDRKNESWTGRAIGWATVRLTGGSMFGSTYAMFYQDPDDWGNSVIYITAQNNDCWLFDMYSIKYRQSSLQQPFRKPPYPYPVK